MGEGSDSTSARDCARVRELRSRVRDEGHEGAEGVGHHVPVPAVPRVQDDVDDHILTVQNQQHRLQRHTAKERWEQVRRPPRWWEGAGAEGRRTRRAENRPQGSFRIHHMVTESGEEGDIEGVQGVEGREKSTAERA